MTLGGVLAIPLIFAVCYITGSVPWGYIIGKINGLDIRKHGSGNIGATNVRRTLGKTWGRICFALDFLKGLIPVAVTLWLVRKGVIAENHDLPLAAAALGCAAGHVWTMFLSFKGGRGVAVSAGALLALAPWSCVTAGVVWAIVFYSSRYVSLASILAAASLPVSAVILSAAGVYKLSFVLLVLLTVIALLAIAKHKDNIKRLLNGTENRFVTVKNDKSPAEKKESGK
jgi:glycerol-3-phosphate acyltransferase PlsY